MKRTTKILNAFVTILLLTMFLSCATFKSFLEADTGYTGDYEFLVKDTPDGGYTGTMTIKKETMVMRASYLQRARIMKFLTCKLKIIR